MTTFCPCAYSPPDRLLAVSFSDRQDPADFGTPGMHTVAAFVKGNYPAFAQKRKSVHHLLKNEESYFLFFIDRVFAM
jgi:hypothetical protein